MKCLVVVIDRGRDRALVDLARSLAKGDQIVLASVIEVPEGETLASAQPDARALRRDLAALAPDDDRVRVTVTVGRRGWDAIEAAVEKEKPDLLIVGWRRPGWDLLGTTIEDILRAPPCDVAVVRGSLARAQRVLVPVRGGRYAELAARVGVSLARAREGAVTLLHVVPKDGAQDTASGLYRVMGAVPLDEDRDELLTRVGNAARVIEEELERCDAIVVGATGREGDDPVGPVGQAVLRGTKPAIVVRTRVPVASSVFLPRHALPADRGERSKAISELVDRWFVENTFSSAEFANLRRLLEAKQRQGVRVSVGLPALNEEATIAHVIRAIRSRLMERVPLVDELVVIDSRSHDRTREIARAEGVPVHLHEEILPELGTHRGKGEALWKSLHVLTGDIVIWVDTDVSNFHPKFVYGILGPLLLLPQISFVKAFYRRPLRSGDEMQATGGGRVTELSARPLLNLFFPELSGIVQPLSGEQGGRRSVLEAIPFFTGYGVETGLLIDVLRRCGLDAIAQVDLKQRIHRNQSLYALSMMSFEILQVALRRVSEDRGVPLWEEANSTMKLISPDDAGRLRLEMRDITEVERPPMITVPAYRRARG